MYSKPLYRIFSASFIFVAFSLTGCINNRPSMVASVAAFHTGITPRGTIKIVPGNGIKDSLEFSTYANYVYSALASKYITRSEKSNSDYIGILSYSIDSGHTEVYSTPIVSQTGGGNTFTTGSVGYGAVPFSANSYRVPTFGVTGAVVDSQQVFTRIIEFKIRDQKSCKMVWEGRLRSSGWKSDLSQALPELIPAMFYDFPGPSGLNRSYLIDDETGIIKKLDQ